MNQLKLCATILHGEIVALDKGGVPRFQLLPCQALGRSRSGLVSAFGTFNIHARNLLRIKSCEFLFQVEAPRGNGGIPSERGVNVERPFESLSGSQNSVNFPVTPPSILVGCNKSGGVS